MYNISTEVKDLEKKILDKINTSMFKTTVLVSKPTGYYNGINYNIFSRRIRLDTSNLNQLSIHNMSVDDAIIDLASMIIEQEFTKSSQTYDILFLLGINLTPSIDISSGNTVYNITVRFNTYNTSEHLMTQLDDSLNQQMEEYLLNKFDNQQDREEFTKFVNSVWHSGKQN